MFFKTQTNVHTYPGVTLVNKAAFSMVDFQYPLVLSTVHMLCNWLGAQGIFFLTRRNNNHRKNNNHHNNSGLDTSHHSNRSSDSNHNESTDRLLSSTGSSSSSSPSKSWWLTQLLGDDNLQRQSLDRAGRRRILAFSVLFSWNIAIGNVSLRHVSVNFNQVMRSLVPALTMLLGMMLGQKFSRPRQQAVLPIVIGVAMACFGDMSYTLVGLVVTIACIVLAAIKVVASGEMLTGKNLKLNPVDLMGHMAPLALVQCLALALIRGEISAMARRWDTELAPWIDPYPWLVVMLSGILSFTLNISSLQANKLTSPLTLCIAANVKQVVMITVSTVLFGTVISPLNGAGIVVVLVGSAHYSYVSVMEKQQQQQQQQSRQFLTTPSDLFLSLEKRDKNDVEMGPSSEMAGHGGFAAQSSHPPSVTVPLMERGV